MRSDQDWDQFFCQFGGRIFTIGALCLASGVIGLLAIVAPSWANLSPDSDPVNHQDLVAFVRAGQMALSGEAAAAYDPVRFQAGLQPGNNQHLWLYPPTAFFAVAPLAALPFSVTKIIWIVTIVFAALGVAQIAAPRKPLVAFPLLFSPATFLTLFVFQVGWFVAAGLSFALLQAGRRPLFAGVLLGILTIKPQYGLLAPVFLLATRNYVAIGAATVTSLAIAALSAMIFGSDAWDAFINSFGQSHAALAMQPQIGGISAAQLVIKLGGGAVLAGAVQLATIAVAATCVILGSGKLDEKGLIAVTIYASLAASPSAWIYDWPLLASALAFWAGSQNRWGAPSQLIALIIWIAAMPTVFGVGGTASPIAPLALLVGLLAVLVSLLRSKTHG